MTTMKNKNNPKHSEEEIIMTNYEYKETMRKLGELALEYAKNGEIDVVVNINNTISDLAKRYSEQ